MNTPGSAPATLVSDIGERGLIERIRLRLPKPSPDVVVGIGDDAAVARTERAHLQVLTTDALVEGVHFDRRFSAPSDIGYKALAVNVSDVAAMGAAPKLALMSLILPPSLPVDDVDALLEGLLEMATAVDVALVGGNITRSPGPLIVDITVIGSIHGRKILTRSGGRPGDSLYVSGTVGAAAAGLGWLREHARSPADGPGEQALAECVQRHRRPEPRARLGKVMGRNRAASACMDLSDGLADAVRQIAEASGTGARIDAGSLPIHAAARAWFERRGDDPLARSISGGDDYELLFAVPARAKGRFRAASKLARGLRITRIGELTSGAGLTVQEPGRERELPVGFVHF